MDTPSTASPKGQGTDVAEPAPVGRPPALTREAVLRAALALVDESGFDGLTVRRLADELNVSPTTLYNYVPSRAAICDGVLELLLVDTEALDVPGDDVVDWLRAGAHAYRAAFRAHPHIYRYMQTHPPRSDRIWTRLESILDQLEHAGVGERDAHRWLTLYTALISGVLAQEINIADGDEWARFVEDPSFRRHSPRWSRYMSAMRNDTDRDFDSALDLLFDDLRRHLS